MAERKRIAEELPTAELARDGNPSKAPAGIGGERNAADDGNRSGRWQEAARHANIAPQ